MGLSKEEVQHLVDNSYTHVKVDMNLVSNAVTAFENMMSFLIEQKIYLELVRKGEDGPDLGFISRELNHSGDIKHFFHWSHDLFMLLDSEQKKVLRSRSSDFDAIDACYKHINEISLAVGAALQKFRGDVFGSDLVRNMYCSTRCSTPYSTNTLRSLLYPPVVEQKGAHPHDDRGFFAVHLYSQNGELVGYKPNGEVIMLRPPDEHAVVFFGAKAEIMTNGYVKSFRHGSMVNPRKNRRALVQFVHADIGMEIHTAEEALGDFRSK